MTLGLRRAIAIVWIATVALTACGGNARPGAAGSIGSSPSAGGTSPASTASPTAKPTRGGATSSPASTSSSTFAPPSDVTGKLDRRCVRRGEASDLQGLTVGTKPGYPVGYATTYADGSGIVDHPEYSSGGQGGGFADDRGVYRDTWVVPTAAPTGKATVRVNAGTPHPLELTFTVVAQNQRCP